MCQNREDEQHIEQYGRHREEVDGNEVVHMIVEKRPPSLCIRGASHMFAFAIRLISARTSGSTLGRPPLCGLRQVQYLRNPARCHLMTVAGLTMTSASLHLDQILDSSVHRLRSAFSPTQADYQSLIDWCTAVGLTITGTYSNRLLLVVSASATIVPSA